MRADGGARRGQNDLSNAECEAVGHCSRGHRTAAEAVETARLGVTFFPPACFFPPSASAVNTRIRPGDGLEGFSAWVTGQWARPSASSAAASFSALTRSLSAVLASLASRDCRWGDAHSAADAAANLRPQIGLQRSKDARHDMGAPFASCQFHGPCKACLAGAEHCRGR